LGRGQSGNPDKCGVSPFLSNKNLVF